MEISEQKALVTGGSKGIGLAIAEALVRDGADVVICARNEDEVTAAADRLNGLGGGRAIGVRCDMRDPSEVRALVTRTVDELGAIDVLVNNAGVGRFGPIDELTTEDWDDVIRTNLDGVFHACSAAVPHMKKRGSGFIINIGSLAGKNPFAGGAAYNASKFGLLGFSEAMMLDVRHHGIRVSCVMPGSVATHFNAHTPSDADAWKIQPEDVADIVTHLLRTPERTLSSRIEVRPSQPPKK